MQQMQATITTAACWIWFAAAAKAEMLDSDTLLWLSFRQEQ